MSTASAFLADHPYAPLLVRMGLIAIFVAVVTMLAERLGPFMGAMVASLPLYTGPIYVLLALEKDAGYLAAATIGSLVICGATPVFALAYCALARTRGVMLSLAGAYAAWIIYAVVASFHQWTLAEALLFIAPVYAVAVPLARGFTRGIAVGRAGRSWFDLPLRAVLVSGVAGLVLYASAHMPPQLTGILSVVPILLTSLVVVLHPRIGGPATSALLAHTLGGLIGMVLAFVLVNLTILDVGKAVALSAGLGVTVVWNLLLILGRKIMRPWQA